MINLGKIDGSKVMFEQDVNFEHKGVVYNGRVVIDEEIMYEFVDFTHELQNGENVDDKFQHAKILLNEILTVEGIEKIETSLLVFELLKGIIAEATPYLGAAANKGSGKKTAGAAGGAVL